MSVIRINQFGGIMPSVEKRSLPDGSAQRAHNLSLRFGDFRPARQPGASVATVVSGAKSIHRTPSGVWLSSTSDVDYVNGLVLDAPAEQVYLTGRSAYPEVWQGGSYRRLGVPAPAAKPTVSVNEGYDFTQQEADKARNKIQADYLAALDAALGVTYAGYNPGAVMTIATGIIWLPYGTSTTPALPANSDQMGCLGYLMAASGSTYVMANPDHNYALDPSLNGQRVVYSGNSYWAVPFSARARVFSFSSSTFSSGVSAIMKPGPGSIQLIPPADVTRIAADYAQRFDPTRDPQKHLAEELQQHIANVANIVAPASGDALVQATKNFYASSAVAAEITTAISNAAISIFLAAKNVFTAPASVLDTFNTSPGDSNPTTGDGS